MKKLLLVIVASLLLSGCFPGLSNGPEAQSTKPGEFLKGKAVKGFPPLPLYPKAKIIESYGNGESFGLTAYIKEDISKVVEFYEQSFVIAGWEYHLTNDMPGYYTFDIKTNAQKGSVIVNRAADNETIGITLAVTAR